MVAGSGLRGMGGTRERGASACNMHKAPSRLELSLLFASTSVMCRWGAEIGLLWERDGIQLGASL